GAGLGLVLGRHVAGAQVLTHLLPDVGMLQRFDVILEFLERKVALGLLAAMAGDAVLGEERSDVARESRLALGRLRAGLLLRLRRVDGGAKRKHTGKEYRAQEAGNATLHASSQSKKVGPSNKDRAGSEKVIISPGKRLSPENAGPARGPRPSTLCEAPPCVN